MINRRRLSEIKSELRKMILEVDESAEERSIAHAIIYLDCATCLMDGQNTAVVPVLVLRPKNEKA